MHPATLSVGRQLDMLFGLYQIALDLCCGIDVDDTELLQRRITERQRLVRKTEVIVEEAQVALRAFEALPGLPSNEQALISEKRQLILDLLTRNTEAEHALLKAMHARMVGVRKELVGFDGRQRAIQAYGRAPALA